MGVCAIPSGAARLSTNKLFKPRDEKETLAEEELRGSGVDEGETSSRIQCSFKWFYGIARFTERVHKPEACGVSMNAPLYESTNVLEVTDRPGKRDEFTTKQH
jgi:hypothetical protein